MPPSRYYPLVLALALALIGIASLGQQPAKTAETMPLSPPENTVMVTVFNPTGFSKFKVGYIGEEDFARNSQAATYQGFSWAGRTALLFVLKNAHFEVGPETDTEGIKTQLCVAWRAMLLLKSTSEVEEAQEIGCFFTFVERLES